MQNRATYEYAVIRVVPKVAREEFINVGVILFSKPKRFLDLRYQLDENRLKLFDGKLDIDQLKNYLRAWELVCKGGKAGGRIGEMDMASRFRWLTAARSTVIQSSPTHSGTCSEPLQVLDRLFQDYVI